MRALNWTMGGLPGARQGRILALRGTTALSPVTTMNVRVHGCQPLLLAALLVAATLPAAAQAPPSTSGVSANNAAEQLMRNDAAADAERRRGETTRNPDAEEPVKPDRVGRVSVEEIEAVDDLPDLSGGPPPEPEEEAASTADREEQ